MDHIEGFVSSIVYQNTENGYTVMKVGIEDGSDITVVGCVPEISAGEQVDMEGEWVEHQIYGRQFKVNTIYRKMPESEDAIMRFLSSGVIKGIGHATARKLMQNFGAETLHVIENEPDRLTKIRGITEKRAAEISQNYRKIMGMRLLMEFLTEHGLSPRLGMPLYRRFGEQALEEVEGNPYLLVDEELGVPFSTADRLAIDLGMEGDNPLRTEAGLIFELQHNLRNGHTFLPREKLLMATAQLLHLESGMLTSALSELLESGILTEMQIAGEDAIYLAEMEEAEAYVAMRLVSMSREEAEIPSDLENRILRIQQTLGIRYAENQIAAIRNAASHQVMLLTGGPGTGKTTTLRGILSLFDQMRLETMLAAPTGRAAKRLGELCGQDAMTIHRLLETQYDPESGKLAFIHDETNPLRADAVIIDETSMVDILLMRALVGALKNGCRLILVGDPDQLPSVGPGNLLSDLIRSRCIPTVHLTEVFRQAAESAIVRNAHSINQGIMPDLRSNKGDFFFLRRNDPEAAAETIVGICAERLPRNMNIASNQIQVLSATHKGTAGTDHLNAVLQEALNPHDDRKPEKKYGDVVLRVGDRVMQIRNNYDVMWKTRDGSSAGMGIYNGDVGIISDIDRGDNILTVDFDGKMIEYTSDMLSELELAYAITVHKAQGSEYQAVVMACLPAASMLLTRGILYTAVTRAKGIFIAVGSEDVIRTMTNNNRQVKRYSGLHYRMEEDRKKSGS